MTVMATYAVYFKQANARLATASLSARELAAELARWEFCHWMRVIVGILAFGAALVGAGMHE
jgi:hypothetical protein